MKSFLKPSSRQPSTILAVGIAVTIGLSCFLPASALAQSGDRAEAIPLPEVTKAAEALNSSIIERGSLPLQIEPDLELPQGIKGSDAGMIVIPDRRLTPERLAAATAGAAPVPVAQIWMLKVAPITEAKLARQDLRHVFVDDGKGGPEKEVQLYLLGATRNAEGRLELQLFGRSSEPILRIPLGSPKTDYQRFPIQVTGHKSDGVEAAEITLSLLGQYRAIFEIQRAPSL